MNWTPGLILRIRNYKFDDDGSSKDKYSIILHTNDKEVYLIHSLTTSQNNLAVPDAAFGCSVHKGIPYYFIPQGQIWGDQNFAIDKNTFIFFMNNVRKEDYVKFNKAAATTFLGVASLGCLSNAELKRLIKCALKSKYLPKEIQQELQQFKDSLQ